METFTIEFKYDFKYNWVTVSNIDRTLIFDLFKHIKKKKDSVIIDRFVPGGFNGVIPTRLLDRTYFVKGLAQMISLDKDDTFYEALEYFSYYPNAKDRKPINPEYVFVEDVIEYANKKGIPLYPDFRSRYRTLVNCICGESNGAGSFSRWVIVYMFRSEFIEMMKEKGFDVAVKGGWILNDKKREIEAGIIDENGDLIASKNSLEK